MYSVSAQPDARKAKMPIMTAIACATAGEMPSRAAMRAKTPVAIGLPLHRAADVLHGGDDLPAQQDHDDEAAERQPANG